MHSQTLLTNILDNYRKIANSNPHELRRKIPSKEIWRFFIDGDMQNEGRNLKEKQPFSLSSHALYNDYTIDEYLKSVEQKDADKLLDVLKKAKWNLKESEYSRFKISDLLHLDKAWLPFERNEPGYLKALYYSFHLIHTTKEPLSVAWIKQLHATATRDVSNLNTVKDNDLKEFRHVSPVSFPLSILNTTAAGLHEFLDRTRCFDDPNNKLSLNFRILLEDNSKLDFSINDMLQLIQNHPLLLFKSEDELQKTLHVKDDTDDKKIKKILPFVRKMICAYYNNTVALSLYDEIENNKTHDFLFSSHQVDNIQTELTEKMQLLVDEYHRALAKATDPLTKLKIIIQFVQQAEQQHPFLDANCRTFCMLLLNQLLIQHGFPLTILEDPNRFDMYDQEELLQEVLHGMQSTMTLIETGSLYHIKTDDVLNDLKNDRNRLNEYIYFTQLSDIEEVARQNNVSTTNFFAIANNCSINRNVTDATKLTMKLI